MDIRRVLSDHGRLNAKQKGEVYRRVFAGEDGLFVLLDILIETGGLARQASVHMTPHESVYRNGARDAVLSIAARAGVNPYEMMVYLAGRDEAARAEKSAQQEAEAREFVNPTYGANDENEADLPGDPVDEHE